MASITERVTLCSFLTEGSVKSSRKDACSGAIGFIGCSSRGESLPRLVRCSKAKKSMRQAESGISGPRYLKEAGTDAVGKIVEVHHSKKVDGLEFPIDSRRTADLARDVQIGSE